jgi:two-component sensor histidine kinase
MRFQWRERGGPPASLPQRKGFGTTLLESTIGKGRVEYSPEGLIYEIELKLGDIVAGAAAEPTGGSSRLHT